MAGKHSRPGIFRSPVGIVSTAAIGVALAVGGTVGAVQLASQPNGDTALPIATGSVPTVQPSGTESVAPTPSASASATPRASTSRPASRGQPRKPAPKATTSKKTSTPRVVGSGSCGASFYDEGQMTANGEQFDPDALTAAHKTLAFNTRVRVTNSDNGKSVVVRINDRGPFVEGRCLDLSRAAFASIASTSQGEVDVKYEILASGS